MFFVCFEGDSTIITDLWPFLGVDSYIPIKYFIPHAESLTTQPRAFDAHAINFCLFSNGLPSELENLSHPDTSNNQSTRYTSTRLAKSRMAAPNVSGELQTVILDIEFDEFAKS